MNGGISERTAGVNGKVPDRRCGYVRIKVISSRGSIRRVFASPFKSIDWSQVSYGVPEWWGPTLPTMMERARASLAPDYKGGTYWDKAIEQIMRDPAANIENVLQQAEDTCKREWLDEYTKKLQES